MRGFAGLAVLELSEGIAGPLCGRYLADLGASVTKLQAGPGDRSREWGEAKACGAIHSYLNRNKQIATMADAQDLRASWLARLALADAAILSFDPKSRPDIMVDWAGMSALNPRLIVCRIADFGGKGAMAEWTGSELVFQAMSGFTRYVGSRDEPPLRIGAEIAGFAAGMAAFQAIVAALLARERDGVGEYVEISAIKALLSLKSALMAAQSEPDEWEGFHLDGPYASPDRGWATSDGYVTFDFRHDQRAQWASFCNAIGVGDIVDRPEYKDWRATIYTGHRRHDLGRVYHPFFRANTSEVVARTVNGFGGISVRLQSYDELVRHPQIQALDPFIRAEGDAGLRQVGIPFELSSTAPYLASKHGTVAAERPTRSSEMAGVADRRLPLDGIRVLDASVGGVGPWAGSLLGMLGAEVVKLEAPSGDFIRNVLPRQRGLSTTYMALNMNKRGIVLDLKTPEGRNAALDLAGTADVFVENFRPGTAEKLGLGYRALSESNPRLIYVSASGFGNAGPMAQFAAADPHIQAFSGFASVNGANHGEAELWRWYGHIDVTTAMVIVQSVLTALWERTTGGGGSLVGVSMLKAALELQGIRLAEYFAGTRVGPLGSAVTYLVPDEAFATLDFPIAVSATNEEQWRSLCLVLELPGLIADPRYRTNSDRIASREALISELARVLRARPAWFWERRLQGAGVPCSRFRSFDELRHHAYFRENGIVTEIACPTGGTLCVGGAPWSFGGVRTSPTRGPKPGEHTALYASGRWAQPDSTRGGSIAKHGNTR